MRDYGALNESEAERAFHSNPWLINLVREYPNDKYPHRGHKKVFTKEELEELFPGSKVFLFMADAPTPHWAVIGGLTNFIKITTIATF